MVTIRLSRGGTKKKPFYSIMVADSRKPRDGRYIERVGYFNPMAKGQDIRLKIELDRVDDWISKGAQPSDRVKKLVKDYRKMPQAELASLAASDNANEHDTNLDVDSDVDTNVDVKANSDVDTNVDVKANSDAKLVETAESLAE